MHDQKLTEELEFLRSSPEYFAFMYGHIKKPERNNQADRLFRRGMPQTAAAMVMEDAMKQMTDRFKRNAENYIWNPAAVDVLGQKPIDHPYLLPPATYKIQNLAKTGELWTVRNRGSVLCAENGFPLHNDYETAGVRHFRMNSNLVIHMHNGHFNRD